MTEALDNQSLTLIEEHVRRLLEHLPFTQLSVRCRTGAAGYTTPTICIDIEAGDEGKLLIGVQGASLAALQHVIRTMLRRQLAEPVFIIVDVNGYRSRREQSLLHMATVAAAKATATGRTIVLQPMAASERRAVHAALAGRTDIKTESMGDEPGRRVVIKPIFL